MTPYIIASPATRKSAVALGWPMLNCTHDIANSRHGHKTVVNWGASGDGCDVTPPDEHVTVVNSFDAVSANLNKMRASLMMATAVDIPMMYRRNVPRGMRVVVRPIEHAPQGGDFTVKDWDDGDELESGHYATEFIDTEYEYRIWKCGAAFLAARRVVTDQCRLDGDDDPSCRSKWGYALVGPTPKMRSLTNAAFEALGLTFGAADVLWDETTQRYYFLEINTAPSLDTPRVLTFFKENLPRVLKG